VATVRFQIICVLPPDDPTVPGTGQLPRDAVGARLYHQELLRTDMLAFYYGALNEIPGLQADLQRLYDDLRPWLAPDRHPNPVPEARTALTDFVKRWALPRQYGVRDLWESLRRTPAGKSPTLCPGARSWSVGPDTGVVVAEDEVDNADSEQARSLSGATISPPAPAPFFYDPFHQERRQLDQHAKRAAAEVRNFFKAAARAIEQEHGLRPIPPLHHNPDDMRRMALRLCRRAVLTWSWPEIARAEFPPDDTCAVPTRGVRESVERWAEALDIPLPTRAGRKDRRVSGPDGDASLA
jgi:hypothetical protein